MSAIYSNVLSNISSIDVYPAIINLMTKASNVSPTNVFLAITNVLHLFIFLSIVTPVDSPLKKPLLQLHHAFLRKTKDAAWIMKGLVNMTLLVIVALCFYSNSNDASNNSTLFQAVIALHTLLSALMLQKSSDNLHLVGTKRAIEIEKESERAKMINFQPPAKSIFNAALAPERAILGHDWTGLDNVNEKPALYVMNHSLYGMDMGGFLAGLYEQKDVYVRGLADHFHFACPHGPSLKALGAVDGTRDNVDALMEAKQNILVYPGGGQEVLKHSSVPKYALMWKQRLGFARLAIKHGYQIIPCASVGIEDMIDIGANISFEFARKGQFLPLPSPTSMNPTRLQKIYFWVGEPIDTSKYNGEWKNDDFAREVRDATKLAVETGINELQEKQQVDPDRFFLQRMMNNIKKTLFTTTTAKKSDDDDFTANVPAAIPAEDSWIDSWYNYKNGAKDDDVDEDNDDESSEITAATMSTEEDDMKKNN